MRKYFPGKVESFCNVCGRSHCDGYGDGSIPDHEPDMDSIEDGETGVYCDICGKSIYEFGFMKNGIVEDTFDSLPFDYCYECIKNVLIPLTKDAITKESQIRAIDKCIELRDKPVDQNDWDVN